MAKNAMLMIYLHVTSHCTCENG